MVEPIPLNPWRAQLQQGERGVRKTLHNLMLYLRNLPGLGAAVRLNQLSGQIEWRGAVLQDTDFVDIQIIVEQAGYSPNKSDIPAAVARLAIDHAYHPVRDYLDGLRWDGTARLDRWLPVLFGTADTEYERAVGAKWLIGAVARIYEPGCKMDNMIVAEGPQDLGKSSGFRALFGAPFFTEMVNELRDHKKFVEQISGKWVVEFAELSAIRKADVELVKAIITMQVDKTRLSYGRLSVELPRQCVLAASVNPRANGGYLTDTTGNRRFWPVRCTAIDVPKIERMRDAIWAEAVVRYRNGEPWWLDRDQAAVAQQQQSTRLAVHPWQDHLIEQLDEAKTYTSIMILDEIIKLPRDRQDQVAKNAIADIMEELGWKQSVGKERDETGKRKSIRVWKWP